MRKRLPILIFTAALTACSSVPQRGGYYDNDGPPESTRMDLSAISDATPRSEPLSEKGNGPYAVFGHVYYPMADAGGYRERGIASWYGRKFHGRRTSSGEPYDMHAMSAAHKTLPLPTYVRVRNLQNGRFAVVRVNDRGPFLRNRLIDLSYAAAAKLGIVAAGTALVEVEAIDMDGGNGTKLATVDTDVQPGRMPSPPAAVPRLYLQVGAFTNWENAVNLRSRLTDAEFNDVHIRSELRENVRFYRVRIGPIASIEESDRLAQRALVFGAADAHIVIE